MAIAILGDVDAADAARVRAFAADALAELGAASLEVPVKVVAEGEGSAGWATSSGVYICADQLDEGDDELRWVVAEEVAHFWFLREHGDDGDDFHHEAFATWFVCAHCDVEWKPDAIDEADSYQLGRLVGGASAGLPAARQALDRVSPTLRVLDLVDRLDGIDDPQAFARELADYHDSPVTRLAARLEARGSEPHLAGAAPIFRSDPRRTGVALHPQRVGEGPGCVVPGSRALRSAVVAGSGAARPDSSAPPSRAERTHRQ